MFARGGAGSEARIRRLALLSAALSGFLIVGTFVIALIRTRFHPAAIDWEDLGTLVGCSLIVLWLVFSVIASTWYWKDLRRIRMSVARVFISHSTQDKDFVRRLVRDLQAQTRDIWFDERSLKPGDSIVAGVSGGLKDTDYLIVVLSPASVTSQWVQAELNAALMNELSGQGTTVLPVLKENCEIPVLLKDRVYADFRQSYDVGLAALLSVFEQESSSGAALLKGTGTVTFAPPGAPVRDDCPVVLSRLTLGDLRRRMKDRLGREEVATIWFGTFEEKMDDDMQGRYVNECLIELLDRAKRRRKLEQVYHEICNERPDIVET